MAYRTLNPATETVEANFETLSDPALMNALDVAAAAYRNVWSRSAVSTRSAVMAKVAELMRSEIEHLAALAVRDMGKLFTHAIGELQLAAAILDYYAQEGERLLAPKPVEGYEGATVHTLPLGVILAVEPWNFPYYQIARVAGPQLMAGNVLLVKHASNVPQCAAAIEDLFRRAGAPAGIYTNLFASTDQVARLIDDDQVRGVTLTGSEGAGASVAERAARKLKKSVLELGGSDPMIVLEDAPVDATIANAVAGRMNNTGQSCVATKRMIVVGRARGQLFLDAMIAALGALQPGDPMDPATQLGPVSSEKALADLLSQIDRAKAAGAQVVLGGRRIDRPGFYLEPTILTEVDEDNPIYSEELFGPVLAFHIVDTEEEALKIANAVRFGLGSAIFTADLAHAAELALQIESGMTFVNHPTWSAPQLPFGGIKASGYGRELGELGIGEFVNRKLVAVSPAGSPPFGAERAG
ncbi:NAD-dependent succinate-semialdehyde dehydrogenase [uncultured Hyphomonas sp.]|uniref:NAD-dependent succinate-semialdehyde dehydrogenase n=1 Tax=uncultured Hyphomonas sp. TaxID=225298 RepID=UPI002AAA8054|nr:NAD-dependent succinate-semialdehyde dehydrogenase [uncultured Hyphomonas sp.]